MPQISFLLKALRSQHRQLFRFSSVWGRSFLVRSRLALKCLMCFLKGLNWLQGHNSCLHHSICSVVACEPVIKLWSWLMLRVRDQPQISHPLPCKASAHGCMWWAPCPLLLFKGTFLNGEMSPGVWVIGYWFFRCIEQWPSALEVKYKVAITPGIMKLFRP